MKLKYTIEILEECIIRYQATNVVFPEKLVRDSQISFTCMCGTSVKKSFRGCYENSMRCKPCSRKTGQEKAKKTNLKRYGNESHFHSDVVRAKIKKTINDRYGVDHTFQVKEFQEKAKATMIEKYGAPYTMLSPELASKSRNTLLENYGVNSPFQSVEIIAKMDDTMINRYGVKRPMQSSILKEKINKTNIKRYGTEYPAKTKEVQSKMQATNKLRIGVSFPAQSPDVWAKVIETNYATYGVANPMQNRSICERSHQNAHRTKEFIMPSGDVRTIQGYENFTLRDLLLDGISEDDIKTGNDVPSIRYIHNDKMRLYHPDALITSLKKIIETKSFYTYMSDLEVNLLKRDACLKLGYQFEFRLYDTYGNQVYL